MNTISLCGTLWLGNTVKRKTKNNKTFIDFHLKVLRYVEAETNKSYYDFISCRAWGYVAVHILDHFKTGDVACVVGGYYIDKLMGADGRYTYYHYVNVRLFEGQSINNPSFPHPAFNVQDSDGKVVVQEPQKFKPKEKPNKAIPKKPKLTNCYNDLDLPPPDVSSIKW